MTHTWLLRYQMNISGLTYCVTAAFDPAVVFLAVFHIAPCLTFNYRTFSYGSKHWVNKVPHRRIKLQWNNWSTDRKIKQSWARGQFFEGPHLHVAPKAAWNLHNHSAVGK